jgi:putative spermidine/putrescine transport system ATP-binding protein
MTAAITSTETSPRRGHSLAVEAVSYRFGATQALDGVSLDIAPGELAALLGPSGCGKTTLLRAIAGFLTPDSGDVRFDGESVIDLPAGRRGVGIVFQNYALFPHMTVAENVAYGLEARRLPRATIQERVAALLDRVRLSDRASRYPRQLSGGQQQRVALARALAIEPRVLLLDEPFAALDKNLRLDMQIEIRRIQQAYGVTTVLVTHDQGEAMSMADRIAVMENGRVHQFAAPTEVYDRPASLFVNQFLGAANLIRASVVGRHADAALVEVVGVGRWTVAAAPRGAGERDVTLSVRPENLSIRAGDGGAGLRGEIRMALPMGALSIYEIELKDGQTVKAAELRNMGAPMLSPGTAVGLELVSAEAATLFGRTSTTSPHA